MAKQGKYLKAFRAMQGITQVELAKAMGVSEKTIVAYERGYNRIRLEFIVKICRHFGVQPCDFGIYDLRVENNYKLGRSNYDQQ